MRPRAAYGPSSSVSSPACSRIRSGSQRGLVESIEAVSVAVKHDRLCMRVIEAQEGIERIVHLVAIEDRAHGGCAVDEDEPPAGCESVLERRDRGLEIGPE